MGVLVCLAVCAWQVKATFASAESSACTLRPMAGRRERGDTKAWWDGLVPLYQDLAASAQGSGSV